LRHSIIKSAITLACVVFIVVIIAIAASGGFGGRAGAVADTAGAVSSPVQRMMTSVVSWLEGVYGYIYKYDALQAENEELKKQIAEAQAQARENAEAVEEVKRLRELLNFSEKHTEFDLDSTKIVGWNPSNWSSTFTISKGSNSGIEVGDCVITESGFLCGQVAELGTSWATVRTVIDVDISIGVLVGEGGNAAMAIGDFSLMQDGCVKLYYLTEGTQLLEGDVIITSGRGGFFPQGLVIGTIKEVRTEAGGQTIYGIIKPSCDFGTMSQVVVIKDFNVVE
jgi:rod shape-determining protein MreC